MTTLSGPELKVTLDGLGIPPSWFAGRLDVTMRTVVRWFDADLLDTKVAAELDYLEGQTLEEMTKMVTKVKDSGAVTLKTYRTDKEFKSKLSWPASWHRALTFRVLEHFRAQDRDVSVAYK